MYDGSVITVVDMVDTMVTAAEILRTADASRKNSAAVLCLASTRLRLRSNIDCRN